MNGEATDWDMTVQLLATIADLLAGANWQRAGKKGGPKPKPIPRPKVRSATAMTARTLDELDEFLGWKSPRTQ